MDVLVSHIPHMYVVCMDASSSALSNDRSTCEEARNVIVHKFTERYGRSWFVIAIAGDHLRCFRLCFFSFNLSFSLGLQSSVRMYVSVVLCVVHEFAERYC